MIVLSVPRSVGDRIIHLLDYQDETKKRVAQQYLDLAGEATFKSISHLFTPEAMQKAA